MTPKTKGNSTKKSLGKTVDIEDSESLSKVSAILKSGGLAVIPTDTVYGLAALGSSPEGRSKLMALKPRSQEFPYGFLIADPKDVKYLGLKVTPETKTIMAKHWPGELTLVLKRELSGGEYKEELCPEDIAVGEASFGPEKVGIRCPDHKWLRDLIRKTGPLATTSANLHKQSDPSQLLDITPDIVEGVGIMADGGQLLGTASAVVDLSESSPQLLREGNIALWQILE